MRPKMVTPSHFAASGLALATFLVSIVLVQSLNTRPLPGLLNLRIAPERGNSLSTVGITGGVVGGARTHPPELIAIDWINSIRTERLDVGLGNQCASIKALVVSLRGRPSGS